MSEVEERKLTLGITNIEDLLLNGRISETNFDTNGMSIYLRIPEYQRPYKWTAKNVNQLLDDIEESLSANKEKYRVGTLILNKDKVDENGVEKEVYNIVDGQQRIITFSLLLKCLVEEKISFLDQELAINSHNLTNVINNFHVLERRINHTYDENKETEKKELIKYIKNHCELIVVITEEPSEAFQFFDSQNARGKALYPHDLLKAYHLREMNSLSVIETEQIVRMWEDLDQGKLALLFNEYLYRIKEWIKGNPSDELTEQNIDLFKGITSKDNYPFAQYFKGAFAFADELNHSHFLFVTGYHKLSPFQLNAPIIAGKPFFEFTKHYFDILADIQNNDKYEGYFINDNRIVKTLDMPQYKRRSGDDITRKMFDTAILLYVDRFCPEIPSKTDKQYLELFVKYAFIWAYSLRAQYKNLSWSSAKNYIMGYAKKDSIVNDFNIYKMISESDTPSILLSKLADNLSPITYVSDTFRKDIDPCKKDEVYKNFMAYFVEFKYYGGQS